MWLGQQQLNRFQAVFACEWSRVGKFFLEIEEAIHNLHLGLDEFILGLDRFILNVYEKCQPKEHLLLHRLKFC